MIGRIISHYKILEKLGEGGMGVVYKAHDTKLDRFVALKFLPEHISTSEQDKERFLLEARAASAINHANVCTIYDIKEHEGREFIVMEYVEGETLRQKIQKSPLTQNDAIVFAIQIGEALQAAHGKNIVHRDVKSENIMITASNQVKVMDFGLAKIKGSLKLTKTSSTLGTLAYMAPEQLQGEAVDARSDIFSFGVVLYEMLTGELPFQGEYESALMYAIINNNPESILKYRSDLSSEFLHILNRILEKKPEDRYQSVDEILIELKRLKRDTDQVSPKSHEEIPVINAQTPGKLKKRSVIGVSAAAILLVIIVGFFSQKLFRKGEEVPAVRENSIAIMYFENSSGEDNFGKILAEMLTSNLSRCTQIEVMSSQHLFDILKRMGKEDIESIDRSVATEVASSAGVQHMLLGSIYKIGSTLNVNGQLCDVKTGSVIGPAQAQGGSVEDIYHMVNGMTEDVLQLMEVSRPDDSEPLRINDVTTYSFEAYKHYQKAMDYLRRFRWQDGLNEFREAVRVDSTFAMAHCYLAFSSGVFKVANPLSDLSEERNHIRLANKYSQQTTDRERDIIQAFSAIINRDFNLFLDRVKALAVHYPGDMEIYFRLGSAHYFAGKYEGAVVSYNKALEIDPNLADAYNMLSYVYSYLNEHEKAISTVRNYIALQPDNPNTYDSAFEIYLMAGHYENAYQVCEDALKINPQWLEFEEYKSYIHLFRGESEEARDKNRYIAQLDPSWEYYLIYDLGCFNMYEGRYEDAATEFEKVVNLTHKDRDVEREISARLVLGKFYSVAGNYAKAIKEFSKAVELSRNFYEQAYNTLIALA